MYIYTSDEIKEVDRVNEQKGMSHFTLMENAGCGLFQKMAPLFTEQDKILIMAGRGNNGGDGIVLARYLKNSGYNVNLVFPIGIPQSKVAFEHLSYFEQCGYKIDSFSETLKPDWIIDGLLGIGSKLPLRSDIKKITNWINSHDAKIISIDIPTGVSSDNGEVDLLAIRANYTFILHGYKPSVFLFPSSENYGKTEVIDIGIQQTSNWKVWEENDVIKTTQNFEGNLHKGRFGTGLLVAGSDEMPGSAALAAIGALRFGIGKLSIFTTKHASTIIGPIVPEATYLFNPKDKIVNLHFSSYAIGPGLNPDNSIDKIVEDVLQTSQPVILDAGALKKRSYIKRTAPTIITPHPGEFSRLIEKSTNEIQKNRILFASQFSKEMGVIVVLKGKYTVISFPDGTGYIIKTGNRALSKGGTGDVLTGMILASVNTYHNIKDAVANAVYHHGLCADLWVKDHGEQSMSAHDFEKLLPRILK